MAIKKVKSKTVKTSKKKKRAVAPKKVVKKAAKKTVKPSLKKKLAKAVGFLRNSIKKIKRPMKNMVLFVEKGAKEYFYTGSSFDSDIRLAKVFSSTAARRKAIELSKLPALLRRGLIVQVKKK
jgi:hypothetical protein